MAEIERKFLVDSLPPLKNVKSERVTQGYLIITPEEEVRVRKIKGDDGERYFQTIKLSTGLSREEIEIELAWEQFLKLFEGVGDRSLTKVRYYLPCFGCKNSLIELDSYQNKLNGLYTVEAEFESVAQSKAFTPLPWFGKEVTLDPEYKNKNLALMGLPKSYGSRRHR